MSDFAKIQGLNITAIAKIIAGKVVASETIDNRINKLVSKFFNSIGEFFKFRFTHKANYGLERVQNALLCIENESKIEAANEELNGNSAFTRLRGRLEFLKKENVNVFAKHPHLCHQYVLIKHLQDKIISRAIINEAKLSKERLKTETSVLEHFSIELNQKRIKWLGKRSEMDKKLQQLEEDMKLLQDNSKKINRSIAKNKTLLTQIITEDAKIKNKFRILEIQVHHLEAELKQVKKNQKQKFHYVKNETYAVKKLNQAYSRIDSLDNKLEINQAAQIHLQQRIVKENSNLGKIQHNLHKKDIALSLFRQKISKLNRKIAELDNENDRIKSDLEIKKSKAMNLDVQLMKIIKRHNSRCK